MHLNIFNQFSQEGGTDTKDSSVLVQIPKKLCTTKNYRAAPLVCAYCISTMIGFETLLNIQVALQLHSTMFQRSNSLATTSHSSPLRLDQITDHPRHLNQPNSILTLLIYVQAWQPSVTQTLVHNTRKQSLLLPFIRFLSSRN